uniref:S-like RNase 29 n=2 Tax=Antirrhinum TaxID=4150 RepID=Q8H697_9LAMI|nr:S-like RNase 29 [Antirrhinum mollissimum]CAD45641.1 S-like RNase 29 [Antirrhinum majus x Antirrhinum hispanicum]
MSTNKQTHIFFLVVCLVLFPDYAFTGRPPVGFEYLKLWLQWPPSFCSLSRVACGRDPVPAEFTIHGLWPDNYSHELNYCKSNKQLSVQIEDIGEWLDKDWPDLMKQATVNPDKGFYEEQWRKHRICSSNIFTPKEYFTLGMKLKKARNLLQVFHQNEIYESQFSSISRINKAIKIITGRQSPIVKCSRHPQKGSLLTEVILCFDLKGDYFKNCTDPFGRACPKSTNVFFPKKVIV